MVNNLYDEVTKQIPKVGDFVIDETCDIAIVTGINYKESNSQKTYYMIYYLTSDLDNYTFQYCELYATEISTITPLLANIMLSIPNTVRCDLWHLNLEDYAYGNRNDEICSFFKRLENYINGVPTITMNRLLRKIGIKRIIEHKHNSNIRIIEFNNNQIWEVNRKKRNVTSHRRNIIRLNRMSDNKIKSIKYTLLRRLL